MKIKPDGSDQLLGFDGMFDILLSLWPVQLIIGVASLLFAVWFYTTTDGIVIALLAGLFGFANIFKTIRTLRQKERNG